MFDCPARRKTLTGFGGSAALSSSGNASRAARTRRCFIGMSLSWENGNPIARGPRALPRIAYPLPPAWLLVFLHDDQEVLVFLRGGKLLGPFGLVAAVGPAERDGIL